MFKVDIPIPPKEQAAIDGRRMREQQRNARIANPRTLRMGMDTNAIVDQVQEKRDRDFQARAQDEFAGQQMNRQERMLQLMCQRRQTDAVTIAKADVEFRNTYQRAEHGRDFDLNDPNQLKNEKPIPARQPGDDTESRLGVSSLQYFEGEDMLHQNRVQLQKQQRREWYTQAMQEKAENDAAAARAKQEKEDFENAQIRETRRQMDELERQRKADYDGHMSQNKAMMDNKDANTRADAMNTARADATDIVNTVNSELMQEPLGAGCTSTGRVVDTCKFKGFHSTLNQEYLADRETQRAGEARRRQEAHQAEVTAHQIETAQARNAELVARQGARDRRARQQQINEENTVYKAMQQTHVLKNNAVAPDFFAQFGTTSR